MTNLANVQVRYPGIAAQGALLDEARRRLSASAEQEQISKHSLAMLLRMEREIQNSAVEGRLVEQLPGVESGAELLRRVGQPPPEAVRVKGSRGTPRPAPLRTVSLTDVVRAADGSVTVQDLYRRSGYRRDDATDVERFYLDLRTEVDAATLSVGAPGDATVVEVTDAS